MYVGPCRLPVHYPPLRRIPPPLSLQIMSCINRVVESWSFVYMVILIPVFRLHQVQLTVLLQVPFPTRSYGTCPISAGRCIYKRHVRKIPPTFSLALLPDISIPSVQYVFGPARPPGYSEVLGACPLVHDPLTMFSSSYLSSPKSRLPLLLPSLQRR